ncbi:hypothetical protein BA78_8818 [Aspergillus fumigatus]|nr:hypothetical protein BA78_8818 [Aspergillus fumigatus]
MDRMFHDRQDDNKQEQNEQHDQPPEVQPQQGTQPIPPVQEREGKSVEDYVDEERKLLQGGDTYSGLISLQPKTGLYDHCIFERAGRIARMECDSP